MNNFFSSIFSNISLDQKILLSLVLLVFLATPLVGQAQQAKDPEALCFTRSECINQREADGAKNPEAGFYTGSDTNICDSLEEGEEMGFCLPAGRASTQIKFGGKTEFANMGQFIRVMYKWSVGAGAILAIIVILISGIQWIGSGGSSSAIKSAKNKIAGAIAGLLLLASSYVILQTINPALVNMRLPQVWMVKKQEVPTAKSEGVCDPTKNDKEDHNPDCSSGQICVALGAGEFSEGACNKLAVASVLAPLAMWGGASAAAATVPGGGAAGAISSAYQATGAKIAELSLPSVSGAVKGIYTGSKVILVKGTQAAALAGAIGVEEATLGLGQAGLTLAGNTVEDILSSNKGVCINEPSGRQEGQFCTPGRNQCAEGLNCIKDDTVSGMTKCWTGEETGFCSDGENGSICQEDSDCDEDASCITIEYGVSFSRQACSDGKEGAPCNTDSQCGKTGDENLLCSSNRCIRESEVIPPNSVSEGGTCTLSSQCKNNMTCWKSNVRCQDLIEDNDVKQNGWCATTEGTAKQYCKQI